MKQLLLLFICVLALFACTSCITDNDTDNDPESYLKGSIKDEAGHTISDASVFILFNDMWADITSKNSAIEKSINSDTNPVTIEISSAYLGHVRTLESDTGHYTIVWNGLDETGNPVCNGVYLYHITSGVYDISKYIMLNVEGFTNRPAVKSTRSGYRLPMQKYFQFGTEMVMNDENGNLIGNYQINGNFEVFIKKEGYQTISRHVSLDSYTKDHIENFVLQAIK